MDRLTAQLRRAAPPPEPAHPGSLLAIADLQVEQLRDLLRSAWTFAGKRDRGEGLEPLLAGRLVGLFFLEPSTRTRASFAAATQALGGAWIDLSAADSSQKKGEALTDAVRTLEAIGLCAVALRAPWSGAAVAAARAARIPVLNAGDGAHEHPTQGLIDALTVAEAHGRCDDFDLRGLRVVYVGDLLRSRVVRSAARAMRMLGAQVTLCGPEALAPAALGEALGCPVERDLERALAGAHAVSALRLQRERSGAGEGFDEAEFIRRWQLTEERAALLDESGVVLHPGPMQRGVEIVDEVADGLRSRILRQAALGAAVRAAALARAVEHD